ncbi:MAG: exo-alpha-sialidase [Clostridia bacterium]|nr:exo-alpha-sialidase [Clostridia bacterium]
MQVIRQGIVSHVTDSFFSYHAWPSACADENGVLYVVCSGFRMAHMCPFGKIVLFKSQDGGRSFGLPTVVCDHYLDDRDPGILYLGGGRMLVTRCSHPAVTYETEFTDWLRSDSGAAGMGLVAHYGAIPPAERTGGCFYRVLTQYGEAAEAERRIPVHAPHGPILLRSGEILYLGKALFDPDPDRADRFSVWSSTDGAASFHKKGDCVPPADYRLDQLHEAHCVELPDGRLLALFRAHLTANDHYFTMLRAVSEDGGISWKDWAETGVCGSPPHLCPTADGAVLTYGRRIPPYGIYGRKVSASGKISAEEYRLSDCADSDIGYPASVVLPDGSIFTVYYARCQGETTASLLSVTWTL